MRKSTNLNKIQNIKLLLLKVVCCCFIGICFLPKLNAQSIPISSEESFIDISIIGDVLYSRDTSISGKSVDLMFDVFYPRNAPRVKRPLLVLAHGGGFMGGDKRHLRGLARAFSRHGFIVMTPNYRLVDDFILDQTLLVKSYAFAVMDMIMATTFLSHEYRTNSNFKIDTSRIIVGGVSAGAVMALHSNFMDLGDLRDLGIEIEDDLIKKYSNFKSHACLSYAGALLDTICIDAYDAPCLFIHNKQDEIVPCGVGVSKNSPFKGTLYGACYISERLSNLGINGSEAIILDEYDVHTSFMRRDLLDESVTKLSVDFLRKTLYPEIKLSK